MSRVVRLAASLSAVLVGLTLLALPAGADSHARIADTGWWWRAQSGVQGVALPPPGNVEKGQLLVQGAPDGAAAIAAIEIELPDDSADAALRLTVADGGDQGGAEAVILACAAEGGWSGAEAGRWDTRPAVDCTTPVEGVVSEDGTAWDFAVSPLRDGRRLSVVLLPGLIDGAPAGLNGSTFSLVFEAPTPASVRAASAPSGGPTAPPADPSGPVTSPDVGSDLPGGFPAVPSDLGPLAPVPEAPGTSVAETPGGNGEDLAGAPQVLTSEKSRTAARVLGGLLAVGGALAAAALWRPPSAAAAEGAVGLDGGLGRFRRGREGDPVPLN